MKLHKALNRMREMHEAYDHARREDNKQLTAWRDEVIQLREQNRVLREALQLAHTALSILPLEAKQHIAGNAMATIHAALTAVSQEGQHGSR